MTEKATNKVRWKSPRVLLCRHRQKVRAVEVCHRLGPKEELHPNRKGSSAQKWDGWTRATRNLCLCQRDIRPSAAPNKKKKEIKTNSFEKTKESVFVHEGQKNGPTDDKAEKRRFLFIQKEGRSRQEAMLWGLWVCCRPKPQDSKKCGGSLEQNAYGFVF